MSNKLKYTILGMMSGTSLDGLYLSLCQFECENSDWTYKILESKTIAYSNTEKKWLKSLEGCNRNRLQEEHVAFGKFLGTQAKKFIENSIFPPPECIASHGHTIFHKPELGITFQAGDGQEIADITKIKTISDFRQKDISLGGQGAPLVPIGDLHLFKNYKSCLNLGGFANISIKNQNGITAFDICPINYVLNKLAQKEGIEFDESGNLSRSGELDFELLDKLNSLAFYKTSPPKSLGREWVENNIEPLLDSTTISNRDKMRTFSEHIAVQISEILPSNTTTLVTGGGAYNTYILELIIKKTSGKIKIGSQQLIEFKEAMLFAFLAALYLTRQNNCLASVTGAKRDSIGGVMYNP